MNRTFKSCPRYFAKLYTVFGYVNDTYLPPVYGLISNKDQLTYEFLFRRIIDQCNSVHLIISFLTDYSRGELDQLGYIRRVGYRFAPCYVFYSVSDRHWRCCAFGVTSCGFIDSTFAPLLKIHLRLRGSFLRFHSMAHIITPVVFKPLCKRIVARCYMTLYDDMLTDWERCFVNYLCRISWHHKSYVCMAVCDLLINSWRPECAQTASR